MTDDLARLAYDLAAAGPEARRRADQAVRKAGLDVVRGAQQRVAVDTGATQSSIGMDVLGPARCQVGPTTHYAPHLEYGTRHMAARPFVGPAADAVEPGLAAAMAQLGADAIGG